MENGCLIRCILGLSEKLKPPFTWDSIPKFVAGAGTFKSFFLFATTPLLMASSVT